MKSLHILDCKEEYEFVVLGINCHCKGYKLCWHLNQIEYLNFEKSSDHEINQMLFFSRYKSEDCEGNTFYLVSNWSSKGYMIPNQKSINFFLIISLSFWTRKKDELLGVLREINNILLIYKLDLEKEKYIDRFVMYDKKN